MRDKFSKQKMTSDLFFLIPAVLYLPVVFGLSYYINSLPSSTKKYLDLTLEPYNSTWDLTLSIFSLFGAYNCINLLITYGYNCSFLENTFWLDVFCYSKVLELLDTIFIVLRSKKLVLLQYYHHLATLIICWLGMKVYPKEVVSIASMNYSIHFLMYGYYFIYSQGYKSIRKYGFLITILQFLQMVISIYLLSTDEIIPCKESDMDLTYPYYYSVFMYLSYVFLFGQLLLSKL